MAVLVGEWRKTGKRGEGIRSREVHEGNLETP
jgi:hypothetical protein